MITFIGCAFAVALGYFFLGVLSYEADKDMWNKIAGKIKNRFINWLARGADAHRAKKPWLRR